MSTIGGLRATRSTDRRAGGADSGGLTLTIWQTWSAARVRVIVGQTAQRARVVRGQAAMAVLRARQPRGQMGTWCPRTRSPAQTGPGSRRGLLWGCWMTRRYSVSRTNARGCRRGNSWSGCRPKGSRSTSPRGLLSEISSLPSAEADVCYRPSRMDWQARSGSFLHTSGRKAAAPRTPVPECIACWAESTIAGRAED